MVPRKRANYLNILRCYITRGELKRNFLRPIDILKASELLLVYWFSAKNIAVTLVKRSSSWPFVRHQERQILVSDIWSLRRIMEKDSDLIIWYSIILNNITKLKMVWKSVWWAYINDITFWAIFESLPRTRWVTYFFSGISFSNPVL